jgi:DNA primase
MAMREWLEEALAECTVTEEAHTYLMGRGASPEVIEEWGIKVWDPPFSPCPQANLHEHYGKFFERFEGKVIYPLYSPKGLLLGFDSRHIDRKDDVRFLLPESRWNPVWIGMPSAMNRLWDGYDAVIVEGRFDVFAMQQLVEARKSKKAVLGSGPAHLSWKQADYLQRWVKGHTYFAYDNDPTGKKGTEDALKNLDRREVSSSALRYGKPKDDPGLIWDGGGVEALEGAFPYL